MKAASAPLRPVIVKKVIQVNHAGHHGGAWKVAYADFVTAMMAFFLLMWLLGATTEKQRKALADYFSPTLVATKQDAAGSDKFFGGDSITAVDKYPNRAGQTGSRSMTIPREAKGGPKEASGRQSDIERLRVLQRSLTVRLQRDANLKRLAGTLRFTETRDGLRIDLVDDANFSMFTSGTAVPTPPATTLMRVVGQSIRDLPNGITIRGHTDAAQWSSKPDMNNWRLSADRAETARRMLMFEQIQPFRVVRIEGVADREPFDPKDRLNPSNRRISLTLTWADAVPEETRGDVQQAAVTRSIAQE